MLYELTHNNDNFSLYTNSSVCEQHHVSNIMQATSCEQHHASNIMRILITDTLVAQLQQLIGYLQLLDVAQLNDIRLKLLFVVSTS